MKKLSLLFATLLCMLSIYAVPTYNLNDGGTGTAALPSGVPADNDALLTDFAAEYNLYASVSATPTTSDFAGPYYGKDGSFSAFVASGEWKWLGDYIIAVNTNNPNNHNGVGAAWRWALDAFFGAKASGTKWAGNANYTWSNCSSAGKPEYWQLAYMIGKGLKPTREGFTFEGWNTNAQGTGDPITTVSQLDRSGTVYAKWKRNGNLVFDYQGGMPPYHTEKDGTIKYVDNNEVLWLLFMNDFRAYIGESIAERNDQPITNAANFTNGLGNEVKTFLTGAGSKWKWLGNYIDSHCSSTAAGWPGTYKWDNTNGDLWRWAVYAFFNSTQRTEWPGSANFTDKGKSASWTPYYNFAYAPVKYGNTFKGWYTTATGSTQVTSVAATDNYATIYAQWEDAPVATSYDFTMYETILPVDTIFTYIVSPKDAQENVIAANTAELSWEWVTNPNTPEEKRGAVQIITPRPTFPTDQAKLDAGETLTPLTDPYAVWLKGVTPGRGQLQLKRNGTKIAEHNIWVAQNPASGDEETAQIGIYAFDLDLKYLATTKEYKFQYSVNAGFDNTDAHIIVALQSDIDARKTSEDKYGWNNWSTLEKKYVIDIPASAVQAKGSYSVKVSEKVLREYFGADIINDNNFQPTQAIAWAIEVGADVVGEYAVFRSGTIENGKTGVLASNDDPRTFNFGTTYGYFINKAGTGIAHSFDPMSLSSSEIDVTHETTGNAWNFGTVSRLAIDTQGRLYITDKNASNAGIYVSVPDEHHKNKMEIWPFFPKDLITIDASDSDGDVTYPIIKDKNGNEIGSAFLATDTYVKTVNGERRAVLFTYAQGHSQKHCRTALDKPDSYDLTIADGNTLWNNGDIPYHCIIEYDLGKLNDDGTITLDHTKLPTILSVVPITGNVFKNPTANIIATSKGMWICHDRGKNNNVTTSTSLQFYGAGERTYSSASNLDSYPAQPDINQFIDGSTGGAFTVNKDNNLLVMQDGSSNLIVFDIKWQDAAGNPDPNGNVPKLTIRDIYHHNFGTVNQMVLDYAGNLLMAGAKGLSIVTIPSVFAENKHVTPAMDRYILSRMHQYDCIFTNGLELDGTPVVGGGDAVWSNPKNWLYEYYPESTSDVRIDANITIDTDAQAHSVFINTGATSDAYKTLTVAEGKSLTVADSICWVGRSGDPIYRIEDITKTDPLIIVKKDASLTYNEIKGDPYASVSVHGKAVRGTEDATVPKWQQTAIPFARTEAADDFYGAYMYAWDATKSNWSSLAGWGHALERFKGYMMTQNAAKEYVMKDKLEATHTNPTLTLSHVKDATLSGYPVEGYNLIGNSWVSPIRIQDLVFTDAEPSVFVYQNSITDKNNIKVGQYEEWPINQEGFKDNTIAPLQAFFVKAGNTGASVILNYYNPLVSTKQKNVPRRAAQEAIVQTRIKLDVTSEKAGEGDELYLFESESYTYDFDNGYESTKMGGDAGTPYLAATTAVGDLAVLATPSFENTMLNFRQGSSTYYTFRFEYNGEEEYYLEDVLLNQFTRIQTGATYSFSVTDDDSQRFRIVRKPEQGDVATEVVNVWMADNMLFMENPMNENVDIRIYGVDGKLVQGFSTTERVVQLSVPITGVYTVQLRTKNTVQTIKCVL